MRFIRLSATVLAIGLFLMACNRNQTPQSAYTNTDQNNYWAKDNLDLRRVGNLLERSRNPQEFETYLNSRKYGVNNLDLNGDGYADYISVDEYGDRDGYQRGLSLYDRFGPDIVQEIATIVFYRDDLNWPGARILLTGNPQIYGDNYYYETDWSDRSVVMITTLFSDRDTFYISPYYYDNYPSDYVVYEVVETPVYVSQVVQLYPDPVFVNTVSTPTAKIKINSPHEGQWMEKVYAKMAKPTKQQSEFIKSNPERPKAAKVEKGGNEESSLKPSKPTKENPKVESVNAKPSRPARVERQQVRAPKLARVEKRSNRSAAPVTAARPSFRPAAPPKAANPIARPAAPARVANPVARPAAPARPAKPNAKPPGGGGGKGKIKP